ncbi:MAG: hypothetical protein AB7U35_01990 [Sphingobium sp.]
MIILTRCISRLACLAGMSAMALGAVPAAAQFYYSPPNLATAPVIGVEPELEISLPGATPLEVQAGMVWHLRAAMNVAALQCDFEPNLLTVSNYNATLAQHKSELDQTVKILEGYFARTVGRGSVGNRAFDRFNTKAYSSYSTVHAQKDFCNVMGSVGREAIFAPRGSLAQVARNRLGEIRRAQIPTGEQYFTNPAYAFKATLPLFTKKCWKKDALRDDCEKAWQKYATSAGNK